MQNYKKHKPHLKNDYYEKALKLLAKREKELPLTTFRKAIIDSQNRLNCQNENDRIRDYLSNKSILPPSTIESLENRKKFLNNLGFK